MLIIIQISERPVALIKSNCCSVSFECFTDYMTRKANGMTSVVSYMNQNLSYRGKF